MQFKKTYKIQQSNFLLLQIIFVVSFLFISTQNLHSQTFKNWYFGQNAALNFNANPPAAITNSNMNTPEGCATYSDGLGNLLFYTNGKSIWMSNNQLISNGTDLNGNIYSTQSSMFIGGIPATPNIFLFTLDADAGNNGLQYTILKSLPSPTILAKNIPLKKNVTERMTSVRHCDRKSFWIIVHGWNNNEFYSYLLTKNGVDTIPVVSNIGSIHGGNISNAAGYMKSSPDGDLIALAKTGSNLVELFRFDKLTGLLSNAVTIPNIQNAYGIEFSYNGNYLYVTSISGSIHQYDLSSYNQSNIIASKQIIYTSTDLLGALQMADNQKIYVSIDNHNYLGCINYPINAGILCNFNPDAVYLGGKHAEAGLPPSFLKAEEFNIKTNTPCEGDTNFFTLQNILPAEIDSLFWDFGDLTTTADTSLDFNTFYLYPHQGSYHAICYVYHCNTVDTLLKDVIVLGPPYVDLGPDTNLCSNKPITYTFNNGMTYLWHDGSTNSSYTVVDTGWVWVQITNVCATRMDSIYIKKIYIAPVVQLPNDTTLCDGDSIQVFAGNDSLLIYIWQNNDTTNFFNITQAGQYSVKAIDSNSCFSSDQINIQYLSPPNPNLGNDTSICIGEAITFNGGPGETYLWNNSITNPSINVTTTGSYAVLVENKCGKNTDTVNVVVSDCNQKIWVPNAFTPDNDGINDIFLPILTNVENFQLEIFNRFGQRIFISDDVHFGWNGKYGGTDCLIGVYTWVIKYQDFYSNDYSETGFIVLFR